MPALPGHSHRMDDAFFHFASRAEAGQQLASRLAELTLERPVVYALPRGGVPVAIEIADRLDAPLDLVLVRKLGAPGNPELALGAIVEGTPPHTVINEHVRRMSGADDLYVNAIRDQELQEMERRRRKYVGDHPRRNPAGCTAIVVDDGLATGATMKAALSALRNQGAARIVVALPVAPVQTLPEIDELSDDVICLHPSERFRGVGGFYRDFHQLTDAETIGLLRQAWARHDVKAPDLKTPYDQREVSIPPLGLKGDLHVPRNPRGIVLFAHGSGSSRRSPRNTHVAQSLNEKGFATLLLDLLTPEEERDRRNVFEIAMLADRLIQASIWIASEPDIADLPLGLFGASTGAGAALVAAARLKDRVEAVVSRGGRPDMATGFLGMVNAPTLLVVGGNDREVIALNRQAYAALTCEKRLQIVPGAGHLFEEPGTLDAVIDHAVAWFQHHLPSPEPNNLSRSRAPLRAGSVVDKLRTAAEPLPAPDNPDFAAAFDRFSSNRIVLLGEQTHGTSEFYRARAAITRHLIEKHGFTIVAVEADWPDVAAIDRNVRLHPHQPMQSQPFTRFPTWMWKNTDVETFARTLRSHNRALPMKQRAGFYGLDLYNMNASIAAVLEYLDRVDPEAAAIARDRYGCLAPWSHAPAAYGRKAVSEGYARCEKPVNDMLVDLLRNEIGYSGLNGSRFFDAAQNARLIANAERYYRLMYFGAEASWNLRDQHMFDTLEQILNHVGPDSKAVVWAHNSHIGDARFTDMGRERGELNIGQLCRQRFGDEAALIGFGTDTGTVAAAPDWDAPMEVMSLRSSISGSYGALCHQVGQERFLLDMRNNQNSGLREALSDPRLERYVGVIYRPHTERWSHYSHAILSDQYDAFVWFDKTTAVTPLVTPVATPEDDTYPFGL